MMAHRFVTVRRGSPAARSGQIQPGDRLEAVEGRAVGGLQHRDLSQILRRAGNSLRLSIAPKQRSCSDGADLDTDGRLVKGPRGRSKDESRFYSVDLERGPTGFGFSLRGGSEYNMGLYVLGLMEAGPAQRSNKIQVSDQLVEINGDSTAGMTHSQAVEQIRRGGHRIHLVLKKGNGYVPDYAGPEEGALSPASSQEQETVTMATASLSRQWGEGGAAGGGGGERKKERQAESNRRMGGAGPPDLDLDLVEEEERMRWKKEEKEAERRRYAEEQEEKYRRRRKKKVEEERSRTDSQKKLDKQGRRSRSLPRNGASSGGFSSPEEEGGSKSERRKSHTVSRHAKHHGGSAAAPQAAFSFLMPMNDDSESAASFSVISQSASSNAPAARENPDTGLGRWLTPSPQRLTQVLTGSRLSGRALVDGLSL